MEADQSNGGSQAPFGRVVSMRSKTSKRKVMKQATVHLRFSGKPICFKRQDKKRTAKVTQDPRRVTCARCRQILAYRDQLLNRRIGIKPNSA